MLMIQGTDSNGNPRKLTVSKTLKGTALRLYEPVDGNDFQSDLEGDLIGEILGEILLSALGRDELERSL